MKKEEFEKIQATKQCTLSESGASLCYREWGPDSGIPILCLPGWPVTSLMFAPFATVTQDTFHILGLDFPGWGQVPPGTKPLNTLDDYAEFVERFVQEAGLANFSLLGYSYGGVVAQRVIARNRISPKSAILISTLYSTRFRNDPLLGTGFTVFDTLLKRKISETRLRSLIKKAYNLFYKTRSYRDIMGTPIVDALVEETIRGDMNTLYAAGKALMNNTIVSKADVSVPVMVEYGDAEYGFIKEDSKELAASLETEPVVLENCDHSHLFVFPERSVEKITEFLLS